MNLFEKIIAEFSAMTGLGLVPDELHNCLLETDGLLITIQYRPEEDEIVISAPVTNAYSGGALTKAMCEKALSLAYDGKGTGGALLGLFEGNLILSIHLPLMELDASAFGVKLTVFADAAISVRAEIAAAAKIADEPAGVTPADGGEDAISNQFLRV